MSGTPEWVRQARMDRAMEMIYRSQQRGDWETSAKWMAEFIKAKEAK